LRRVAVAAPAGSAADANAMITIAATATRGTTLRAIYDNPPPLCSSEP
jgi:hypothetical protein